MVLELQKEITKILNTASKTGVRGIVETFTYMYIICVFII